MNERVQEFLDKKQSSKEAIKQKRKNELLISLGLCDKVYSPKEKKTKEYCYEEWDEKRGGYKYYSATPIDVTDEEFEKIKAAIEEESKEKSAPKIGEPSSSNSVASALRVIAIVVYIAAFFVGCAAGDEEFLIALACWVGGFISGTLFLGFAEIINLLTAIKNKKQSL